MKKVIVLGAGLVGNAIISDLAKQFEVTAVDYQLESLKKLSSTTNIKTVHQDLSLEGSITSIVKGFDLVIGALPGFMGFRSVSETILAGVNMVDISFFPQNPFLLDKLAKQNNVVVVTDCGVAPGMGNIILGYHNKKMLVDTYACYVGGLPFVREWPFEYKAVFSPIDVIEEYIRPARYVENGKMIVREALSDPELLYFEEVGTLEAWNSDGLRSLISTMNIPNMIEKTMRYPGCIEYLRVLREAGFFSYEPIEINGMSVRPIDMTAKLLFPKWKLKPGEEDFTAMKIIIHGIENGSKKKIEYKLFDRYDRKSNTISMARTTGYTCTAAANLVLDGSFQKTGINPPEFLGENENHFNFILKYLEERGVKYEINTIL